MIPPGQLPVGALDLVSARVRRHAQNVVVIAHRLLGYVGGDGPDRYDRGSPHPSQGTDRACWYNPEMKECPLCGEAMRLHAREVRDRPGVNSAVKLLREWICPECDYFEEAEAGEG